MIQNSKAEKELNIWIEEMSHYKTFIRGWIHQFLWLCKYTTGPR